MKIKLFLLSILTLSTYIYAEDKINSSDDHFFYFHSDSHMNFNIENGVFSPFVGFGTRQVYEKNGLDWNFGLELYPMIRSKFDFLSFSLTGHYLRFFDSDDKNKYYIGIGPSFIGLKAKDFFYLDRSPSIVFGKHFIKNKTKYFVQLKINWPNFTNIWVKSIKYHIPKEDRDKRLWSANAFITTGIGF